jgi:hypothetical protein
MKTKPSSIQATPQADQQPAGVAKKSSPKKKGPVKPRSLPQLSTEASYSADSTPMFSHPLLSYQYPIIQIATLAADVSTNPDLQTRLADAIRLLHVVEQEAFKPDATKRLEQIRARFGSSFAELTQPQIDRYLALYSFRQGFPKFRNSILSRANRDSKTNRIQRTSLVSVTCQEFGRKTDSASCRDLFNDWVEATRKEMTAKGFKGQFESGSREQLIHDDETASVLLNGLLRWLLERQVRAKPKARRSRESGTLVPKKSGGAITDEKGKFKRKRKTPTIYLDPVLPGKRRVK